MKERIKIFSLVIAVLFVSTLFLLGVVNTDGGNQKISPIVKPVLKVIFAGANNTICTSGGLTGSGMLTSIVETATGDFRFESMHTSITLAAYKSMSV